MKKAIIPFGVVTTSFLFTSINAKAETNLVFQSEGIFTKIAKHNIENGDDVGFVEIWSFIGNTIVDILKWFFALPEGVAQLSATLLTKVYELLMLILHTPLFIFNNSYIKDTSLVFATTSILIVTILTSIELIKKMLLKKHTDFKDIIKRWSLAVVGSGFAPFLFEQSFNLLNIISKAITQIGVSEINSEAVVNYLKMSVFNTHLLIAFDLIILALMIPIFLQNGRRFFDLMCLAAITPLALTAWVFDDYRHYFNKWWNQVKALGSVQLVYSTFVCLFGIFIFGTRNVVDGGGLILKLLISIGGLYRFANPPRFIKEKLDNGEDIIDMGKNMWKTSKDVWNVATLKPTRLFIKNRNEEKLNQTKALRKKHGRRYVKGLK